MKITYAAGAAPAASETMGAMPADGSTDPDFAPVAEAFDGVLAEHERAGATGAALAVWLDGRWVVDLWGGHADAARSRPWQSDTLAMPYSVSKPFAAVCALVLADRGLLDLDRPVSTYWPEMTADTTVRQLLSHQSGHAYLEQPVPTDAFYDWDLLCRLIAEQPPQWPPGSGCGESALLYGHLVGELVRRIDGRSLGTFLTDEVCGPLELDFHLGLSDPQLQRTADLTGLDGLPERIADRSSAMARALANPPGSLDASVVNSSAWRRAEIPAVNGHGSARAVAGLFAALGEGRLLSPAMTADLEAVAIRMVDHVLGHEAAWGLGVQIEADGFGMGGTGGSLGWWSNEGRTTSKRRGRPCSYDTSGRMSR